MEGCEGRVSARDRRRETGRGKGPSAGPATAMTLHDSITGFTAWHRDHRLTPFQGASHVHVVPDTWTPFSEQARSLARAPSTMQCTAIPTATLRAALLVMVDVLFQGQINFYLSASDSFMGSLA
jgi:hypothetical protein